MMTSLLKKRSMAEPALWAWFLLTATFALHAADRQAPVKVMSFNIRYGATSRRRKQLEAPGLFGARAMRTPV